MSKPLALKWRIALLTSASVAVVVGIITVAIYGRMRGVYMGQLDRLLLVMGNGVAAKLDEPITDGVLDTEVRRIVESPWKGTGTMYRIWRDAAPDDLAASTKGNKKSADFLWNLPTTPPDAGDALFLDLHQKKKEYRAIWRNHAGASGKINVLIAHPSSYEQRRLNEFLLWMAALGGGLVVFSGLISVPIARVALRPIAATVARLSQVTHKNLGRENLKDLQAPAELVPFVTEAGELLARLDHAMQRQVQFTGDASHELRTPLALAQSSLQLASSRPRTPEEYQRAIDEAVGDLTRMEAIVRQLLILAQTDEREALRMSRMYRSATSSRKSPKPTHPRQERMGVKLFAACHRKSFCAETERCLRICLATSSTTP